MNELVKAFEFQGDLLVFRRRDDGRFYVTEGDLAERLQVSTSAVGKIRKRHPKEFKKGWLGNAAVSISADSKSEGRRKSWRQWLYSPEAVAIVSMHVTHSPVGSEFRVFAAEVLTKFYAGDLFTELQAQNVQLQAQNVQLKSEVSFLRSQIARVQDVLVGLKQGWATTGRLLRVVGGMFLSAVTPDEHAKLVFEAKRRSEERRAQALRRRIALKAQGEFPFIDHKKVDGE